MQKSCVTLTLENKFPYTFAPLIKRDDAAMLGAILDDDGKPVGKHGELGVDRTTLRQPLIVFATYVLRSGPDYVATGAAKIDAAIE